MTVHIPLEIVIKIFTLATRRRNDAASWIRLSRQTYTLFERLLYTKVVLLNENIASTFVKCYRLRQAHIEALPPTTAMLMGDGIKYNTIIDVLSLCKDITNLCIVSRDSDNILPDLTSINHILDTLPLTALSLIINSSLTRSSMVMANTFAKLTHLEIDDEGLLCRLDMSAFHQLTHLALWTDLSDRRLYLPRLVNRLLQLATLKVLVFRAKGHRSCARSMEYHGILDRRIVIAPSKVFAWDHFGQGSMLLWELADETTNIPGPNHRKHRCFSNSTFENRFRDLMAVPRVRQRDVDRELVHTLLFTRPGIPPETIWIRNDSSDDSREEEITDDDKEEDSTDEVIDENSPSDDAEDG
ncbi:uncharacterized protein EDB91DRAFT_1258408 [Suillus paluster]|uniref:uncharacterized protein n=1 Tax=Suillus paluster TaxID=48578 RepID=UPI001B884CCA|nr:uncharacterized protein EDB91DRAFT_1258408 [Suillus paluster]KAG1718639.1 hypothetical protein EDB91DRAFT_1258408 [Suillus paluster]